MKKSLQIVGGLIAIFILFGLFLGNSYHIERQITINASRGEIHALVNDLTQWPKWAPWLEMDPTIKVDLGEVTSGVGAHQKWTSERDDPGALTFTAASEENGIAYDLFFGKPGEMDKSEAKITYHQEDPNDPDRITVTWRMDGAVETPIIGPYISVLVEYMVPGMFDRGLKKLKIAAEK